ncbi:MAG: H-NS histone family protein [Pseudomonadota bacterium]|nr:H-NS histone family protein [Pseudomonadota bacterium]
MAPPDLSDYTLGELKGLQFDVAQEIRKRRHDELAQARAQIDALAERLGLTVQDVLSTKGRAND